MIQGSKNHTKYVSKVLDMYRSSTIPRLSVRKISFRTGYHDQDSKVDTDEILTDNNPWSPTLYEDPVKIYRAGSIFSETLPKKYRMAYQTLYESPSAQYVGVMKRLTISLAMLGCYGAKLFYESPMFDDYYAIATLCSTIAPGIFVQIKTKDYVSRIFRLYNKEKSQELKDLLEDENLIMEKITFGGGKTYNELLPITGNKTLKLAPEQRFPLLQPYCNWQDDSERSTRHFYVVDNIGGLKMDRIWGIVEHNSGKDNGRYFGDEEIKNTSK